MSARRDLRIPIYAATAWGDEAYFALLIGSMFGAIVYSINKWIGLGTACLMVGCILFACFNPLLLATCPSCETTTDAISGNLIYALTASILLWALSGIAMVLLTKLTQGIPVGMTLTESFATHVAVKALPFAKRTTTRLLSLKEILREHGLKAIWRHSLVYDDPPTIGALGTWLTKIP
jgi:hypothetical protein